ncbi:MAG: hypothetical protein ACHP8B_10025 [Terriglobales bacterium]
MQRRTLWTITLAAGMLAFAGMPAKASDLFNNTNLAQVSNCRQPVVDCAPKFTLITPAKIDEIHTYHRAGGPSAGKAIGLRDAGGSMIIPSARVTVQPASPGFENWVLQVGGQQIPAGTYTVVDSQADTWQQNARSCDGSGSPCNRGFAIVLGTAVPPAPAAGGPAPSVTDCLATCTVPPGTTSPPTFSCSAHGPNATCRKAAASSDFPGGGVTCTDGINVTTCNCQSGCSTH